MLFGAKIPTACAHQVARLSAFRAMRRRSGRPSSSSAGTSVCNPLKQAHLLHMVEQTPANFGRRRRRARTSTGWPTRASSNLMRWEIADCDKPRPARHARTGLLDHSGQGGQQFIVEHQFS
jgi:hypothetical protein